MIKIVSIFLIAIAAMVYFILPSSSDHVTASNKKAKSGALHKIGSLPSEINESSGIVVLNEEGRYLTHNDAGNKPYLYQLNNKGKIEQTIKLNLPNVDWEDLTIDDEGNIYIADTGNNNNKRRELAVYKVNLKNIAEPEAIRFTYEDQKEYPPQMRDRNFDCEAIFWHNGDLYLISKDRGMETTAKVYQLPDKPGNYKAKLIGSRDIDAMVTGAAISPNGQTVALLSEGKLHLFTNFSDAASFYEGEYKKQNLKDAGQTEGVAFEDDNTLIITSEGGNIYRYGL